MEREVLRDVRGKACFMSLAVDLTESNVVVKVGGIQDVVDTVIS